MRKLSDDDQKNISRALKYAVKKHHGQYRDGTVPLPYAVHPVQVLHMARYEAGMADPEVLMAAVLHDVVEDSDATLEKIEEKFGERVASLVGEMTRKEPAPEQTRSMTYEEIWELRNKWMLEEIRAMSPEAQIIKLCDRISNITDGMTTKSPTILARYVKQTEQILHIIPRETHPKLWDKLTALAEEAKRLTV